MTPLFRTIVFSLFVLAFIIAGIPSLLHRFGLLAFFHFALEHGATWSINIFPGSLDLHSLRQGPGCAGPGDACHMGPSRKFVSRGLYRMVRNPMYIGIVLILTGEACFFQSPSLLLIRIPHGLIFHVFVIFSEEPTLRRNMGILICSTV